MLPFTVGIRRVRSSPALVCSARRRAITRRSSISRRRFPDANNSGGVSAALSVPAASLGDTAAPREAGPPLPPPPLHVSARNGGFPPAGAEAARSRELHSVGGTASAGSAAWTTVAAAAAAAAATAATLVSVNAAAATPTGSGEGHSGATALSAAAGGSVRVAGEGPGRARPPLFRLGVDDLGGATDAIAAVGDTFGSIRLSADNGSSSGEGEGGGWGGRVSEYAEDAGGHLGGKYEIGRLLGEGSFGLVYEARPVGSDRRVALKQISKLGVRREDILQEMSTLKAIHAAGGHENIARVLDVFEDPSSYVFVLELVSGGEMFEHLTRNGPYSEATAAEFMRELAAALRFLHSKDIIHADLKPENLMLSSWDLGESKLKVVDFGSSLRTGTMVDLASSPLGTTWYLPPEAVRESKLTPPSPSLSPLSDGSSGSCGGGGDGGGDDGGGGGSEGGGRHHLLATGALDMWAVGCILYITLCGAHPFDLEGNSTEGEVLERIRAATVPLDELGPGISDSAKDLISRLLSRNPQERLTAEEMMQHPWIQGRTAPEIPLKGSDARLARFRQVLSQNLETGVVSMLVEGAVAEGGCRGEYTYNPYGGDMQSRNYATTTTTTSSNSRTAAASAAAAAGESLAAVDEAVDVVKKAYKAFDRRGTGRVSAQDIAGFLEEHSARVSDDERRAIDEAVSISVAQKFRRPSGNTSLPPERGGNTTKPPRTGAAPSNQPQAAAGSDGAPAETSRGLKEGGAAAAGATAAATAEASPAAGGAGVTAATLRAAASAAASIATDAEAAEAAPAAVQATKEEEEAGVGAPEEEAGLEMSDFEDLLLDQLKTSDYPTGEFVFREGDNPDGGLYFIVEGRVDVLVDSAGWRRSGEGGGDDTGQSAADPRGAKPPSHQAYTRVASLGPGDFFGEGGVISAQPRGESVRAATPVKVINVGLASCHRMIDAPGKVSSSLRRVALSRALFRAKNVVRAVHSVTRRRLGLGEAVFRQGDQGASLFTVDEGELDVVKEHSGVRRTVAKLSPGSFFGEMALMTSQPRSASVVCAAEGGCTVEEISGDDFARLLMARKTGFRRDVMRMLRARQFRHGVYKLLTELGSEATFSDEALRQVFDRVDTAKSGTLTLDELKAAFCRADPLLPPSAVEEIMTILDLDAVGSVSFDEFLRIIRWDP